ncbi:molybdopterin-guanine dinucleotide biosynthesis protein [Actinomycetaceae bacterium WB03_NA08]|uniref:Molybdopterin-guanine dinucleotide biosynthesis protein n=1 Tax=Scrofimicrobium canadense TaxID=2652290 RepID=A0A6N7WAF3_9ACTO|nr:DUF6457 domain-containing protein [Scrofimicrobium canadense]MSS85196.1 molybdopterin-guanine dinucleotide biosynthesis protein [Scrofimicrobium canadense]
MAERRDDPAKMEAMREWLCLVAKELEVPVQTITDVEAELLDLIGTIAHGPSRPGAPLTAYLVGYAAGRGAAPLEEIAKIDNIAKSYQKDSSN